MKQILNGTYINLLAWNYSLYKIGEDNHEYKITMTALPLGVNTMLLIQLVNKFTKTDLESHTNVFVILISLFMWLFIFNVLNTRRPGLDLEVRRKSLQGFSPSEILINMVLTFLPFVLTLLFL